MVKSYISDVSDIYIYIYLMYIYKDINTLYLWMRVILWAVGVSK